MDVAYESSHSVDGAVSSIFVNCAVADVVRFHMCEVLMQQPRKGVTDGMSTKLGLFTVS